MNKTILRSGSYTHQGRVRTNNEDRVFVWPGSQAAVAVVADGMGGAAAGEEASRIAIETLNNHLQQNDRHVPEDYMDMATDELAHLLESAIQMANLNINQHTRDYPAHEGMGTTLTIVFVRGTLATFAHVGDSRAYRVTLANPIEQVTRDQSFVQMMMDAGHLLPEEAEEHPMSNVLYQALGQDAALEIEFIQDFPLNPQDRIVLCSDGLTLHVEPNEIERVAREDDDPDVIAQTLVEMAVERGGRDNVSVGVIIVQEALEDTVNLEDTADVTISSRNRVKPSPGDASDDTIEVDELSSKVMRDALRDAADKSNL